LVSGEALKMADKDLDELKDMLLKTEKLLQTHIENDARADKASWVKLIGPLITVLVLSAGIIGGWYTNKASVATLQSNQVKLEDKVDKLSDTTHDIELKVVQERSDLKSVKEDMTEVKQDVKDIRRKLLGN